MLSVTLAARPARTDVDAIPQLVEYPAVLAKETKLLEVFKPEKGQSSR